MKTLLLMLTTSLLLISCKSARNSIPIFNPIEPPAEQIYVPGEVAVGFVDTINYAFIVSFVRSLKLEPIEIDADSAFSMWMRVDSGNVTDVITRLQQDPAVAWAQQRGYEGGDPQKAYLLAHFLGTVDTTYALELIGSIKGVSWVQTIHPPRIASIKVPEGQEIAWIAYLETYPFVRWAELNYLLQATTN